MRIEFPFAEEKANIVPTVLRPLARVKLVHGDMEVTAEMYVDSGADITLIPYSVGTALGFSLKPEEELRRIGGVGGGRVSIAVRRVELRINGEKLNVRVAWCMSEDVPLILGRLDIFDKFNVSFEGGKKTVFLK